MSTAPVDEFRKAIHDGPELKRVVQGSPIGLPGPEPRRVDVYARFRFSRKCLLTQFVRSPNFKEADERFHALCPHVMKGRR